MEGVYRPKEDGVRVTHKSGLFQARSPSLIGRQGVSSGRLCQVLIRKFQTNWFKILLQGEAETTIRLLSFGLTWLGKMTPFWPVSLKKKKSKLVLLVCLP